MAQDQYFDVPRQLRELVERSVEQTRGVYCQIMDAMAQATSMWLDAIPSNETTLDLKTVHERAVRFAKQNGEACFAFARELAKARDVQDVLGIQGRYAQTQMQAYALQAQELGNLMARASQSMRSRS
jgi:hypothetical protein